MSRNGSSGRFSRIVETPIIGNTVVGEQVFELNEHAPRNNVMDYLYFVDSGGALVKAVTGRVDVAFSPVTGIFQCVTSGTFKAETVTNLDWKKPNGFGKVVAVRISFSGIKGAVGFRSNITQSVD